MIQLQNLTKFFGNFKAVDNINLIIEKGKITSFLGPNGAGKTTTIKMIVGLLKPTQGNIIIDTMEFNKNLIKCKKMISYIPDFPFLYERLTGLEYLEFVAGINNLTRNETSKRIKENLILFDIENIQNNIIKSYSHGLRQRLIFCSALIKNPEILIIDEPMVGLDPKTARIFKDVLLKLSKNGTTVFLSTHQLSVAEELSDYIAIINKGEIQAEGTLKNLLYKNKNYKNLEHYFLELTS